jgi:hypothetical protein
MAAAREPPPWGMPMAATEAEDAAPAALTLQRRARTSRAVPCRSCGEPRLRLIVLVKHL